MLDVDVVNEVLDPEELLKGGGKGCVQLSADRGSMSNRGKEGNENKEFGNEAHGVCLLLSLKPKITPDLGRWQ